VISPYASAHAAAIKVAARMIGGAAFASISGGTRVRVSCAVFSYRSARRRRHVAPRAGGAGRTPVCRTCTAARRARGSRGRAACGAPRDGQACLARPACPKSQQPQYGCAGGAGEHAGLPHVDDRSARTRFA